MKMSRLMIKRIVSFCMVLAMVLTMLPASVLAADGTTVYLKPNANWKADNARFAVYYWNDSGNHWISMTDSDGDGYYEAVLPSGYSNIIFCRMNPANATNGWNTKWNQTADLTLPTDGKNCYTVAEGTWDKGGGSWSVYTPSGDSGDSGDSGNSGETTETTATYIVAGTGGLCGTAWDLANTANQMTLGDDGLYTITYESVLPGEHKFKVTDGTWNNCWGDGDDADGNTVFTLEAISDVTITFNATSKAITVTPVATGEVLELMDCAVTLHFADALDWGSVCAYVWTSVDTLTGEWPGDSLEMGADGFYTYSATLRVVKNQPLKFIFNNGGSLQTVDLSISADDVNTGSVEKWVVPTTLTDTKYNAAIVNDPKMIVTSPVVKDNAVTFNYGDSSAESVAVAGSFNNWTVQAMTQDEDGVWTLTVEDLEPGNYQYKFVVDGDNWIIDPMNSNVVTDENENQNSAFYILSDNNAEDDNKVTIRVHYTRADGNYEGWNLWVWGSNMGGHQVDFETIDANGAVVATIVLEDARSHQDVKFKERLSVEGNEWKDQGSSDRSIDLSTIVSGTIDYYLPAGTCTDGDDVIRKNKVSSVNLDYDIGTIAVTTVQAITNPEAELKLMKGDEEIAVTIQALGSKYMLALTNVTLDLKTLYQYKIHYGGYTYDIGIDTVYASDKFAEEFTYTGTDLGANWTAASTKFVVWAPTATEVSVKLYDIQENADGTYSYVPRETTYAMTAGENGTWAVSVDGNLDGVYYNYLVLVDGETVEAVDPYARTTGVNGERGMVIDLDSTDPEGWEQDKNPNEIASYTDAIIYELHVRDFSIDSSFGATVEVEDYMGKFLAFTLEGTTVNGEGNIATGIDYLKSLGVTHIHLLPVYDYGSVDETKCENFNWGYDPVNYNVPEGSYSTDPYHGEVRVNEFKQMVMALHDAGISVIMDVVYNHVYNADKFCFNQIVPGYFSRVDSNTSGCGNDTASEREMVSKYIVESVAYWCEEYHIDGFRFDLVGLIDVDTINELVRVVHEDLGREDVIFYGEGWNMDGTNKEEGTEMAKQGNADMTPGFAYFSDSIRNQIAGSNGATLGFVSGGEIGNLAAYFLSQPESWGETWTNNPQQVVQYASCHDNYTLIDKLVISTSASGITADIISMNNLAAAIYMTAQGIPFIHAGEEMLREKLEEEGGRCENSYNAPDFVNKIRWDKLNDESYTDTLAYYQGLIAFRKAHPALRYASAQDVSKYVKAVSTSGSLMVFFIDGYGADDTDDIYIIFNSGTSSATVNLPAGTWNVCIDKNDAGTESLYTAEGTVSVDAISAMVLTKADEGENKPEPTVTLYFSNNKHWTNVYAYAWSGTTYPVGAWPGSAMTYVETNDFGEDIYSITIPASVDGLIFHNNDDIQTVDITEIGVDGTGYYISDDAGNVATYVYRAPIGGGSGNADDFYLFGYIDGADYACEGDAANTGDYLFEDGTLTVTFLHDSYVGVKTGDNSIWYMTDGWLGNVTSATLYNTTALGEAANKLMIPGGVEVTFALTENDDGTLTLSYVADFSGAYEDETGIQDGVTLHCWNWSFAQIEANMAKIAEMGFTAIQTSPIQPLKEATTDETDTVSGCWWLYYQPVGFTITDGEGNALGTQDELTSMIKTAHEYGIQVIVDVVANHLGNETGNDLSSAIPENLLGSEYWHDITKNTTDYTNRYQVTQYCMAGLPDLNTANETLQGYVLDFLKACIDIGVDGFRFDGAKHIETPDDDASFASDFWPTVIGGAAEYAAEKSQKIYFYGEVLDSIDGLPIYAYTKYMSVTDNSWGNTLRQNIAGCNAVISAGYDKAANASNLVIWAESHDTYATDQAAQSSAGVNTVAINKTWALVAARADAMGLYFARPASDDQLLGIGSVTGWYSEEVEAVNKFHNYFAGQSETVGSNGNIAYVIRGNSGIVLVNVSGTSATVSLSVSMADGTYKDQITGNTFTVAGGTISGAIGSTGIAVVYVDAEAKIGDAAFEDLQAAIDAAEAGETVVLLKDAQIESLTLLEGITFDLNGHTLTADYVTAYKDNSIIDSNGDGLLKVSKNRLSVQQSASLPVWNGKDGYVFATCAKFYEQVTTGDNTAKYTFLPKLSGQIYELLAAGTATSGVTMKVEVSWVRTDGTIASITFAYSDALLQQFYEGYDPETGKFGYAFTLSLTGTQGKELSYRVFFESETGAKFSCNE